MRLVHVRVGEHIGDPFEDWVLLGPRFDYPSAGLALVVSPVAYPAFSQHPLSKSPKFAAKGMGAGAQADHRYASVAGIIKVFVYLIRPSAKTQQHDNGVRIVQGLGIGQTLLVGGIYLPLVIQREKHGAFEAVALTENLRHHRQAFLTAIFLITSKEHQVLALAFVHYVILIGVQQRCDQQYGEK